MNRRPIIQMSQSKVVTGPANHIPIQMEQSEIFLYISKELAIEVCKVRSTIQRMMMKVRAITRLLEQNVA